MPQGFCSEDDCTDPIHLTGLCRKHYYKLNRLRVQEKDCKLDGCKNASYRRGLCRPCYLTWKQARDGRSCTLDGCNDPLYCKGMCSRHYSQMIQAKIRKEKNPRRCDFPNCGKPHWAKGCCQGHYAQLKRGVKLHPIKDIPKMTGCKFEGCMSKHSSQGYCSGHYYQFKMGKELTPIDRSSTARRASPKKKSTPKASLAKQVFQEGSSEPIEWGTLYPELERKANQPKPVTAIHHGTLLFGSVSNTQEEMDMAAKYLKRTGSLDLLECLELEEHSRELISA